VSTAPLPRDPGWQRARALVLAHGWNAVAYQILNPGIRHWFAGAGDAVVGYATYAGTRVVAGAPVCAADRVAAVADAFAADARAHGQRVVYFGAGRRFEERYAADPARPRAAVPLGAQPWWDPAGWEAIVGRVASLRAQCNRARNKGVRVAEWTPEAAHEHPALRRVLAAWLAGRGLPTLHFLVEPETLACLADRRVFVAESGARAGGVVAFLVATPIPARGGWLLEQWPRLPDAPNGTVELLVDAAMRALGDAGARAVTMGLAPLSARATPRTPPPPAWIALALRWARAHGQRFYDFGGLDAFKAKFRPDDWEPIAAVADRARFTPRALWAVAGVFGRGSPVALVARALAMAGRDEARRAVRAVRRPARRAAVAPDVPQRRA
jgi:phosphatidylglycerol lysyltransferase